MVDASVTITRIVNMNNMNCSGLASFWQRERIVA